MNASKDTELTKPVPNSDDYVRSQLKSKQESPVPSVQNESSAVPVCDMNSLAVKIRDMTFGYDRVFGKKKTILENINMTFPKNTMYAKKCYGLLGPSGCGKTTLLKLILGLKKPKTGIIEVNGRKPSDPLNKIPGSGIGFQPQELALYREFTIKEILNYFAEIYGMDRPSKEKQIKFLIQFLELPDPDRTITNLSGGQQRRVSLAVSVVHKPPFLILDEPTVGMDPLLVKKIWEFLVKKSKEEMTSILITTHYIEEARRVNVVALMRSGRLLVEQSPINLMNYFNVNSLEKVFLNVCKAQDKKIAQPMPTTLSEITDGQKKSQRKTVLPSKPISQGINLSPNCLKRCTALVKKNCKRLSRNPTILMFQIFCPTISMIIFLICVGQVPEKLKVAVYNQEVYEPMNYSYINESDFPNICYNMSSLYLKKIDDKYINLINFSKNDSAIQTVKSGKTFGSLVISRGFSWYICSKAYWNKYAKYPNTDSAIKYYGDMTDYTIFNTILRQLWLAHHLFIMDIIPELNISKHQTHQADPRFNASKISPQMFQSIVEVSDPPIDGDIETSFGDFMTPGMTIAVIFILAVGLTALSFVTEKKEGLMGRTLIAGVNISEILIAQILLQIIVLIVQVTVLLTILFLVFKLRNKGSLGFIIIICVMQGVLGITFGLVISIVAPDEQSALMIAFGSFFPTILLSAIFWPIYGMPYGLQMVSYFMPQTTAVISLRNIILKGWGLNVMPVWIGFASTLVWTAVFFILSVILTSI